MRTFVRYLGYILLISALFRVVPVTVALYYGETYLSYVGVATLSLLLGGSLLLMARRFPEKKDMGLTLSRGLMLAALSFVLLPLLGAISFLPSFDHNILDAVFESISGFTTTGLTLYSDLDSLPKALLMWRAMTQWIGGIGVVMIFLFIFSRLHSHDYIRLSEIEQETQSTVALYQAQGFDTNLGSGLKHSVTNVMLIYCGYTLLGIILLLITGLPFFDALAMTFTSLSTGGFSVSNGFYSAFWPLAILSLMMLVGSFSFLAHIRLFNRKWKDFLYSFEKNVFLILLTGAILLTLLVVSHIGDVTFMLISAFTTTGYSLGPIAVLPHFFIMMICLGMLMGGSIGSTAGGIKTYRVYYLMRAIPWSLKKLASPRKAVIPLKVHGQEIETGKLANIAVFVFAYFLFLVVGILVFLLLGHDFLTSAFQVISALGTVGLQTMDLMVLNPLLKLILIFAMLLGRLEIFPLLILFRSLLRRKH